MAARATILDLKVTLILPIKSIGLSVQKFNTDFQDGSHVLAIFDLQVTKILPTKFPVNWPFSSKEEVQNRFLRQQPK